MEIVNAARHTVADITTALDKAGREYLVLAIKATYKIPENDRKPRPIIPPQPLIVDGDVYVGEPGTSATLYEIDFVLRKKKCDVIFNASAHAPFEIPVEQLRVAVKLENINKELEVTGNRYWKASAFGYSRSETKFFTQMPLHYGRAFGGFHTWESDDETHYDGYLPNLVGTGYGKKAPVRLLDQCLLPNLSVPGQSPVSPGDKLTPVALSALARNSPLRAGYAGTYDEYWRENDFPFLPQDFDERYFQCAPEDQQIDFPVGGESVTLINMMKGREHVCFKLPRFDNMKVKILKKNYEVIEPQVVVDTLYFEPDEERFSAVWRAAIPIKRRIQEFDTIAIGPVCKDWWGEKTAGRGGCGSCKGNSPYRSKDDE